jgi:hypothetical protein
MFHHLQSNETMKTYLINFTTAPFYIFTGKSFVFGGITLTTAAESIPTALERDFLSSPYMEGYDVKRLQNHQQIKPRTSAN